MADTGIELRSGTLYAVQYNACVAPSVCALSLSPWAPALLPSPPALVASLTPEACCAELVPYRSFQSLHSVPRVIDQTNVRYVTCPGFIVVLPWFLLLFALWCTSNGSSRYVSFARVVSCLAQQYALCPPRDRKVVGGRPFSTFSSLAPASLAEVPTWCFFVKS